MFRWLFGLKPKRKRSGGGNQGRCPRCAELREENRRLKMKIILLTRQINKLKELLARANQKVNQLKAEIARLKALMREMQAYYTNGLKRIMAITMTRQRLSTHSMPQIRGEANGMLGTNTQFHGWTKSGKPRTRAPS